MFDQNLSRQGNYIALIKDSLNYFSREDFTSLSDFIGDILTSASRYEIEDQGLLVTYAGFILRDYCRIQFAHRHRINARYINYHNFTYPIHEQIDHNHLFGTILKHERITNTVKLENFTTNILKFSALVSNHDLKNDTENFIARIGKEKVPLPERVLRD